MVKLKNLMVSVGRYFLIGLSLGAGVAVVFVVASVPFTFSDGEILTANKLNHSFLNNVAGTNPAGLACENPLDPLDEMVKVGTFCLDKYESSVWDNAAGEGIQYGVLSADYPCLISGYDCRNLYARSVVGVFPSAYISWAQAQRACANVGKRLPTNAEWQLAVAGTFDPAGNPTDTGTACRISGSKRYTGTAGDPIEPSNSCISEWGAEDMIGNVREYVSDWQSSGTFPTPTRDGESWAPWPKDGPRDVTYNYGGRAQTPGGYQDGIPAAITRGGNAGTTGTTFNSGDSAGAYSIDARFSPQMTGEFTGFRCAR